MRMNVQRNLVTCSWQLGKSWDADRHVVTHAASLNNGLIRMLDQQLPSKVSNHVAPHCSRSLHSWGRGLQLRYLTPAAVHPLLFTTTASVAKSHKEHRLNLV